MPSSYEYPIFAVQKNKRNEFIMSQFNIPIAEFIDGIFTWKLKWHPERKRKLIINTVALKYQCKSCRLETNIITGVDIFTFNRSDNNYIPFDDPPAQRILHNNINSNILFSNEIGEIKYNNSGPSIYCFHCHEKINSKELEGYYQYPDEYGFYDDDLDETVIKINESRKHPIYIFYIEDDANYLESIRAWFFDDKQESRKF